MGFNKTNDHIHALAFEAVGFLEHFVGLSYPGCETEVDFEPAALLPLDQIQEMFGRGPPLGTRHRVYSSKGIGFAAV
jgi:hypothetical protein